MKDQKEHRQKKQGIVEKKMQSKPSFKNLFNIEKQKVQAKDKSPKGTNRSRSKSNNKSVSQQKIGTVPLRKDRQTRLSRLSANKSETQISINNDIKSPKQNSSAQENKQQEYSSKRKVVNSQYQSEQQIKSKKINKQQQSHISKYRQPKKQPRLSISPKSSQKNSRIKSSSQKNSASNELFKVIINMKNDITRLQKIILKQQKQQQNRPQNRTKPKKGVTADWQTVQKLKKIDNFITDYQTELKTQTVQIGDSYLAKLEELQKQISDVDAKYLPQNTPRLATQKPQPNMKRLEDKIRTVSKMLM